MATAATRGRRTSEKPITFGEALRRALAASGTSQRDLATELGLSSQSVVSQWISETHEPSPSRVFAIEEVLGLAPGTLSRLLGYLPLRAVPALDVPAAVAADPELSSQNRAAVLAVYEVLRSRTSRGRRRG